jgi:hypothetical protein
MCRDWFTQYFHLRVSYCLTYGYYWCHYVSSASYISTHGDKILWFSTAYKTHSNRRSFERYIWIPEVGKNELRNIKLLDMRFLLLICLSWHTKIFFQFSSAHNSNSFRRFADFWKATVNFFISVLISVRPLGTSAPTVWVFTKFVMWEFFQNMSIKFNFY